MDNMKYAKYMRATCFCRSMLRMRNHKDYLNVHDIDNKKYADYMGATYFSRSIANLVI